MHGGLSTTPPWLRYTVAAARTGAAGVGFMSWQRRAFAFAARHSGTVFNYPVNWPRSYDSLPATLQFLIYLYTLPFRLGAVAMLWELVLAYCLYGTILLSPYYLVRWVGRAFSRERSASAAALAERSRLND